MNLAQWRESLVEQSGTAPDFAEEPLDRRARAGLAIAASVRRAVFSRGAVRANKDFVCGSLTDADLSFLDVVHRLGPCARFCAIADAMNVSRTMSNLRAKKCARNGLISLDMRGANAYGATLTVWGGLMLASKGAAQ